MTCIRSRRFGASAADHFILEGGCVAARPGSGDRSGALAQCRKDCVTQGHIAMVGMTQLLDKEGGWDLTVVSRQPTTRATNWEPGGSTDA